MANQSKEAWDRKRAYSQRTFVAGNSPVWEAIKEEKHIRPSRKKRNAQRLLQHREKIASLRQSGEIKEGIETEIPAPIEDVSGTQAMMKIKEEQELPTKVIPIAPGEAWRLRQGYDKSKFGDPRKWGELEGLIEIYAKYRYTDDTGRKESDLINGN